MSTTESNAHDNSPTTNNNKPKQQLPWLKGPTKMTSNPTVNPSEIMSTELRSTVSDRSPGRGIFHFLEAREKTAVVTSAPPAAEKMPPPTLSRTQSPIPPAFSPITPTPTPDSPAASPINMAHDGDEGIDVVQPDLNSSEGTLFSEIPAAGEDAKTPRHDRERTEEFEEETERARRASRKSVSGDDSVESEEQGPRLQASWVSEAVATCLANKKNPLNKGNILVMLNGNDVTKSCLLDGNEIAKASDALKHLLKDAQETSAGCPSDQNLTAVLVVPPLSTAAMPELVSVALDTPFESLPPQPQPKEPQPPIPAKKGKTRLATQVKVESDQGDGPASADEEETTGTDWPKAYESLFRMIAGSKKGHGISKSDLSAALPQIEGVVRISQKYSAIHEVQAAFDSLFYGYVGKDTFWESISKEPVRCIKIAVALQNRPVYEEAFKHLVGSSANFKAGKTFDGLSDDVQAKVQHRARELYLERRDVEDELTRVTLPGKRSQTFLSQFVSQHDQPIAYNTVNLFRDWISEHIGHLRNETDDEPADSFLCDHSTGCSNVAGFFDTIADQNYLDPDEVWGTFNERFKSARPERQQADREMVKKSLEALKGKASALVDDIHRSTLHLSDMDEIEYLKCIEVGPDDLPWDIGSDEDSDEEMDED